MNGSLTLKIIASYFGELKLISHFFLKTQVMIYYYTGDRKPSWPIVAFGMIGAVLSGVTFLHIPGKVGNNYFYYLQFVFGNVFGYIFIKDIMI